jgi:two-component system chemotaxis response regulator CheB
MNATKVLVVDDRVLYRKILRDVVDQLPGAVTVGTAVNGENCLRQVERLHPDLVLLDVEMPVMDGLSTLKVLKRDFPGIKVVMVSGGSRSAADLTVQALEHGAVDFIPKPNGNSPEDSRRQLTERIGSVLTLVREANPAPEARAPEPARPAPAHPGDLSAPRAPRLAVVPPPPALRVVPKVTAELRKDVPRRFSVLAVGTSTGGPAALGVLIPALPASFPLPVVVVQHMPPGFTHSLAQHLNSRSELTVSEAQDGDEVARGRVLIAPGGRHMEVVRDGGRFVVRMNDGPPVRSCRPSVDVLFESVASAMSTPVLSLVMTGMGDDGANGVGALAQKGSYNLVQDAESCVVFGMPRAVAERGLAHEHHPLNKLAQRLRELAGNSGGPA